MQLNTYTLPLGVRSGEEVTAIILDTDSPMYSMIKAADPTGTALKMMAANPLLSPWLPHKRIGAISQENGDAPTVVLHGEFQIDELRELIEQMLESQPAMNGNGNGHGKRGRKARE